jgi:hypothetical protein
LPQSEASIYRYDPAARPFLAPFSLEFLESRSEGGAGRIRLHNEPLPRGTEAIG